MRADVADCLNELQRVTALPDRMAAVLAVGSAARGWANADSDYDVYIIAETAWYGARSRIIRVPLQPPTVPARVLTLNGRRWDLKYWLDIQVDQMLSKVTWEQFEHGPSTARVLVENEELFLERLVTAVPLRGGDWLRRRRLDLDNSAFRAFVTTRSLAEADNSVEDALGQLAAGDAQSAVLSARKALGHSVDALLESRGHYGSQSVKWRPRRLREAALPELDFDRYWALETMAGFNPSAPRVWIEQVLAFCRDLLIEVEI